MKKEKLKRIASRTKNEDTIVIKKINKEDFSYLLKHSEKVAKKLWDNKDDEVWNNV